MARGRSPAGLGPNALGSLYMTLGSLAYVVNDSLVRAATDQGLDVYQALFLRGCAMLVVFTTAGWIRRERLRREHLSGAVLTRVAAEVVATALFFAALVHLEFANAQTILMLVPFAVTAVAALTLGERVGPLRYLTVVVGFVGVLAVVRPTPSAFSPWALVVVAAAMALVVREFATRRVEPSTPPLPVAFLTAVAITSMMGLISMFTGWGAITGAAVVMLVAACCFLVAGYLFTIETVRVGDLSVSAPFRYTTVVGAVVLGLVMFGERPDALTLIGCVLIVGAGVIASQVQ